MRDAARHFSGHSRGNFNRKIRMIPGQIPAPPGEHATGNTVSHRYTLSGLSASATEDFSRSTDLDHSPADDVFHNVNYPSSSAGSLCASLAPPMLMTCSTPRERDARSNRRPLPPAH